VEDYEAISKTITTCFLGLKEEKMAIPGDNDIMRLVLGGEIRIIYSLREREEMGTLWYLPVQIGLTISDDKGEHAYSADSRYL
jgi:hypothetical protein